VADNSPHRIGAKPETAYLFFVIENSLLSTLLHIARLMPKASRLFCIAMRDKHKTNTHHPGAACPIFAPAQQLLQKCTDEEREIAHAERSMG
jgi:hypothetical protein